MQQYSIETSFWLRGLDKALAMLPAGMRQDAFDAYVSGKDRTRYTEGLRDITDKYGLAPHTARD